MGGELDATDGPVRAIMYEDSKPQGHSHGDCDSFSLDCDARRHTLLDAALFTTPHDARRHTFQDASLSTTPHDARRGAAHEAAGGATPLLRAATARGDAADAHPRCASPLTIMVPCGPVPMPIKPDLDGLLPALAHVRNACGGGGAWSGAAMQLCMATSGSDGSATTEQMRCGADASPLESPTLSVTAAAPAPCHHHHAHPHIDAGGSDEAAAAGRPWEDNSSGNTAAAAAAAREELCVVWPAAPSQFGEGQRGVLLPAAVAAAEAEAGGEHSAWPPAPAVCEVQRGVLPPAAVVAAPAAAASGRLHPRDTPFRDASSQQPEPLHTASGGRGGSGGGGGDGTVAGCPPSVRPRRACAPSPTGAAGMATSELLCACPS